MSSYGNRCWTPERDLIAQRLVLAAINIDDDEFENIINEAVGTVDMVAVAALLAEQLAGQLHVGGGDSCGVCPIEARIVELESELEARNTTR